MKKTIATAAILSCSALLTACGGSGSDGSAAPAPTVTVTESAAAESSTTSTTSPTSSSETTTTTESESGSRGSRGSGSSGDSELDSDEFPDNPNYIDDQPSRSQSFASRRNTYGETSKSDLSKAGLESWHITFQKTGSVSQLTYPTMDSGKIIFNFEARSKGDDKQLECSVRVFDPNGDRVPDDELDGTYRSMKCGASGATVSATELAIANPGEYTLVFGVRNIGFDPLFMSVPVDIVE